MDFKVAGMYVGMSVLQGGPGILSKHLYNYFTGVYINLDIKNSEVPEQVRQKSM